MYISTRGFGEVSASRAIIEGLAKDGGLYLPKEIKKLDISDAWLKYNYKDLANIIFKEFLDDFTDIEIKEVIDKAYSSSNFPKGVVTLDSYKDVSFLSLYNGPTFAFKDVALTVLPLLMEISLKKNKNTKKTVILTATSGDTGSAAMSGFSSTDIKTIVLYPNNGVSRLQEAQMHSFMHDGSYAIAINGNFDDCQRIVKEIFKNVKSDKVNLASANSINIGRLIPQIVYYFYAYFELVRSKKISFKDKINFVVPTGNFGNILACYIAKRMGLYIDKIVCASNKNNVLTDFFNSGVYNKNRSFYKTISPSMDILVSSNLERYLYYKCQEDPTKVCYLMDKLNKDGLYELKGEDFDFIGEFSGEEETMDAIRECFNENKRLIDPHTAVAYNVYRKTQLGSHTVIASTASPFKFVSVYDKIFDLSDAGEFNKMKELSKKTDTLIDERILKLENVKVNKIVLEKDEAINKIKEIVGIL